MVCPQMDILLANINTELTNLTSTNKYCPLSPSNEESSINSHSILIQWHNNIWKEVAKLRLKELRER